MRQLFVAGNWKMNTDLAGARELAGALKDGAAGVTHVTLAVFPPFVYLGAVVEVLAGSNIAVGAQNMYLEDPGPYTGETAGQMLIDVGCTHVIVGHSERRHVMGETDDLINGKVLKALDLGLKPILCVGEKLDQREAGQTDSVVTGQIRAGLAGVAARQMPQVTLAYEPVWAIGTGRTATRDQAEQVHGLVRGLLSEMFDSDVAEATVIQYGGSVKPENAAELMSMPNVDGALVGGASLKADQFIDIIRAAAGVAG